MKNVVSININQLIKLAFALTISALLILLFLIGTPWAIIPILVCLVILFCCLLMIYPRLAFYTFLISIFIAPIIVNFVPSFVGLIIRELPFLLIYCCIFFYLCIKGTAKLENVRLGGLEKLALILFFLMLFQAIRQDPISIGLLGFRTTMYYSPIFFFTVFFFNTKEKIRQLITVLLYIGLVLAAFSILQHIFTEIVMNSLGFERGDIAFRTRGGFLKANATLGDASTFAAIITANLIVVLCLSISRYFDEMKSKFNPSIYTAIFGIGLILSLSRINYLAFIAVFVLMGFFFKKRIFRYYSICLVLFFLINIVLDNMLVDNITSAFAMGGSKLGIQSTLNRVEILKKGFEWFLDRPIIGHGLGVTGYPSLHHADLLPGGYFVTDNYYLKLLIESGLIGASLFVLFLLAVIKRGLNLYYLNRDPFLKNICLALTLGILVMIINGLANSALELPAANSIFWLMIGLVTATRIADQKLSGNFKAL